jgi:hypothetical protein
MVLCWAVITTLTKRFAGFFRYLLLDVVNWINIYTVINPATTCMIISVMAYGQPAPGMGMETTPKSGTKLITRNIEEIMM